ncbi:ABC transporter permease [Cohnella lubricantis]|uniref:ABC transporter permease n=1 Tax=Cohnella lubricantis TaxID=2163172 RepID=A0A841T5N8_9BACL|nr:ABC transporter permease [Cohnella lubricantis]MBB6676634.1 ABC transporter permease [Cohnella lubricantis]MBP2117355.1 ABC-2 type transport system permease protein [Cohnella lubricantis]
MNNLLRFEWYKLMHNRTFWLGSLFLLAAAIAYPIMDYYDAPSYESGKKGLDVLASCLGGNEYFLKIGVSILGGFFLSSEYANGTMKRSVSAGAGRTKVVLSKLLVFMLGSAIAALIFPVVGFTVGSIIYGVGDAPGPLSLAEYLLRTLGETALLGAAYGAFTGMFATALTDSGKTIGLSFAFYFFVDYLFMLLAHYMPFMEDVYDYSIFLMIKQVYTDELIAMSPLRIIAEPVLTALVCLAVCIAIFRRKEIK